MPEPFYLTTPIYYVNDRPHIGHCYTTVVADVVARFERLRRGSAADVFLLTGTDEHADKVVTSAAAHGKSPQQWADQNAEEFRKAFAFMGVSNDDFIRTTEPRHRDRVPHYIRALMNAKGPDGKGLIYRGEFTGWYDESAEAYVTDTAAREQDYKSTIGGRPLVKRTEPCYFFKLSAYQQPLLDLISQNPAFVQPDARRQEVLGRLRPPAVLNDVPVSRPVTDDPATQWGIRIPGDDAHRVYVWIDALFNYLTVVDTPERRRFWPARHVLGKDILWFHAVIWPALLMALKVASPEFAWVALPRQVFGHGWWISEGQKMSKSLGNFIDLERLKAYADRYSLDAVRWYLATQGPLSGTDSDFSHAKFVETYNADLANGIGNCASRVGNMVEKYFGGALPAGGRLEAGQPGAEYDWPSLTRAAGARAVEAMGTMDLAGALGAGADLVRQVDQYINVTAPFKIAKTVESDPNAKTRLGTILHHCAEAVRVAAVLMSPAMPGKMGALLASWGASPPAGARLEAVCEFDGPHGLRAGQRVAKGEILFQRANPADPPPGAGPGTTPAA
ncbi:MAG: methionine--tRNA ligase [Phycisphaerae bacterium]|nr:MAG: methionine--tRNA ligase [Phycisphaerae bacterium]